MKNVGVRVSPRELPRFVRDTLRSPGIRRSVISTGDAVI